ncbi:endonuclease domain-containing protein [Microbacterium marinilacus]|uniref:DUF559 domain-containing protein n=1 Tax=Microbacterium marinilacus TaxID=415209 RepID=A0ABP7BIF6_9MICO|nr:DUF559 domain-containing protein [Microbacterium marinilacus]MBY0689769.1 endonuclease domain-containing protein [Microbacterium marinilacus]
MRTHGKLPEGLPPVFGVAQARAAGATPKRLRQGDLERPFHGVRRGPRGSDPVPAAATPAEAATQRLSSRVAEYLPVMPAHAFFAGVTAAVLQGIPVPVSAVVDERGGLRPLVVGVHEPRTPPRRPQVRGVRVDVALAPVDEVAGVRVTSAAATWAMLAGDLDDHGLVAAADHLLRVPRHPGGFCPPEREPFAVRDELAAAIGRRRGAARLRRALDRARTGASSPPETRVRLMLVDAGLAEPVLDHDVFDRHGRFVGCLDLAYPELKIGIEYDGSYHRDQQRFEYDIDRIARLEAEGWLIVRLTSRHVHRVPCETVRRVRDAIARRAA